MEFLKKYYIINKYSELTSVLEIQVFFRRQA